MTIAAREQRWEGAMFQLDFSLLPEFVGHRIIKGLPAYIGEPLEALRLPETLDRLRGASRFLGEVSSHNDDWLNRAYLRAGLSEFRSVAQALHWDLGRREVHSPEKSRNPLIHLIFRLRRLTVYVANAPTAHREVTAVFRIFDEEHSKNIRVLLIDGIESYLRREKMVNYEKADVSKLCDWFESNQRQYGASQVLYAGVLQYCEELCWVYSVRVAKM